MTEAIFVLEGILEMAAVLRTTENHLETETKILNLSLSRVCVATSQWTMLLTVFTKRSGPIGIHLLKTSTDPIGDLLRLGMINIRLEMCKG